LILIAAKLLVFVDWALGCILYEMVNGKTPFAKYFMIPKLQPLANKNQSVPFHIQKLVNLQMLQSTP
jgi:serine/threonine protein kinase